MKRLPAVHPGRLALLVLAILAGGCTTTSDSSSTPDYKSGAARGPSLEVPPDLTQLSRESRFQTQGGVVSAAASTGASAGAAPVAAAPPATGLAALAPAAAAALGAALIAPQARGDVRIERDGSERWLVVPMPAEQLWPLLKSFWTERGFTIATENLEAGVMETNWSENRAKLPNDAVRNMLGSLAKNVYDTGERDRFRTRVERTPDGCEVYISHRGAAEVYISPTRDTTTWTSRPNDPQLEAEFLSQLMVRLGKKEDVARAAVANPPETPARARMVGANATALEVDEPFDRTWRRVGLALDRSGFTVEDRDRASGLYFVRYVDPKNVGKEDPNWFARLFGAGKDPTKGLERYRIAVKAGGEKTQVAVLSGSGAPETGETGKRIAETLVKELR